MADRPQIRRKLTSNRRACSRAAIPKLSHGSTPAADRRRSRGFVALGQDPAVQLSGDFNRPILMEVLKIAREDFGPVVDRHGSSLGLCFGLFLESAADGGPDVRDDFESGNLQHAARDEFENTTEFHQIAGPADDCSVIFSGK